MGKKVNEKARRSERSRDAETRGVRAKDALPEDTCRAVGERRDYEPDVGLQSADQVVWEQLLTWYFETETMENFQISAFKNKFPWKQYCPGSKE